MGGMKRKPERTSGRVEELRVTMGSRASKPTKKKPKSVVAGLKKRKQLGFEGADEELEEYNAAEEAEMELPVLKPIGDGDICSALMERYARSSAKQHRHLCATAAVMKSILSEEDLPLTPPAYFAAAITAVRDIVVGDQEGAAALASFLAVVLPLVPAESLPKAKAKDACFIIASFLKDKHGSLPTGTLRSMVKSLGLAALMLDLDDWLAVKLPLETLLLFSMDKRPKVRRCAQSCLEKLFKIFPNSFVKKKASKLVHFMHRNYLILEKKPYSVELTDAVPKGALCKSKQLEALHMLNVLNVLVPYLSNKVKMKILSDAYIQLGCHFSWSTRLTLKLLETFLEHSDVKVLVTEAQNVVSALTLYISTAKENSVDTIFFASILLERILRKFKDTFPSMWIIHLPLVFASLIGYLESDSATSKPAANILKDLINFHISQSLFSPLKDQPDNYKMENISEAAAVASICSEFIKTLNNCSFPSDHMLDTISVLFLRLGGFVHFFMKEILIRLSEFVLNADSKRPNIEHLEHCIGAAVIAMGPEKLLTLVPIAIDMEKITCSNLWILPILKKYVVGASLQYFMDSIVPLLNSIQVACKKAKSETVRKSLQTYFHNLWDLLPAFCRYPIDLSENFKSFSMLIIPVLKEEPSLHEVIASGLQALVYSNIKDSWHCVYDLSSFFPQVVEMEFINFGYSKRTISTNIKALASSSVELFHVLKDLFFEFSEKRGCIKETLRSLGYIIPSQVVSNFFLSSLNVVEQSIVADHKSLNGHAQVENKTVDDTNKALEKNDEKRRLLMDLASSFIETADTDLINMLIDFIRSSLLTTSEECQCEAYFYLCRILKEKESYSCAQIDELMELLFTVEPPTYPGSLKNRFSCFHYLLVYILKNNVDDMNTKAYLILNEIILQLKSKDSRRLAYDTLLTLSEKLKSPHSCSPHSYLMLLFNMVMGYLSSSSPQIISGAVSALSLLIYHDASFCLSVPELIPSVLVLLQSKANEVIKATLGFIKVLVSSLICKDLMNLLPEILRGILPWSLVSKNHFRSKVGIILEILMRKCSSEAVENSTPAKYKGFVKSVKEGRRNRKASKGTSTCNSAERSTELQTKGGSKRPRDNLHSNTKNEKIWKKSKTGFSNSNSSSKVPRKGLRNQSNSKGHPNSLRQNNTRPKDSSRGQKRRSLESEKNNVVDTRAKKPKRLYNSSEKKPMAASEARNNMAMRRS